MYKLRTARWSLTVFPLLLILLLAMNAVYAAPLARPLAANTIVGSYAASTGDGNPLNQGWSNYSSGAGNGSLITDLGALAWKANGTGGRAQWRIVPTSAQNSSASTNGWKMTWVSRVVSGNCMTDYYANGAKRFLANLSIDASGNLIAALEGGSTFTLVAGTGASVYHTYETQYNPATGQATFRFDGNIIQTWAGSASSQNMIIWGHGCSTSNGVAHYRSVSFEILGAPTPTPTSSVTPTRTPTPTVTPTADPNNTPFLYTKNVFVGGQEGANGTSNYRIPALDVAPNGALLAFIEGRPGGGDPGSGTQINISYKRSTDKGRTWTSVQRLFDRAGMAHSDPRPVVDAQTGTIFLFVARWGASCGQNANCPTWSDTNQDIRWRTSTDNGVTWSATEGSMKAMLGTRTWRSINPTPGRGIQLKWQTAAQGSHNGRLIIPVLIRDASSAFYVASLYSDDHGTTWQAGNFTPNAGPNESDMVELTDGRILLTSRNEGTLAGNRLYYLSSNGGVSWTRYSPSGISITKVDASIGRLTAAREGADRDRILFSGPLGNPVGSGANRYNLGVWKSYDEGQTFPSYKQLVSGASAYSALVKLTDGTVGILYEGTAITFLNFNLAYIEP